MLGYLSTELNSHCNFHFFLPITLEPTKVTVLDITFPELPNFLPVIVVKRSALIRRETTTTNRR